MNVETRWSKQRNDEREESADPAVNPYVQQHRELAPVVPHDEAVRWKGRWSELFGRSAPLQLEVGSGNGFFLSGMAARHSGDNWLGVEIRYKRVVLCARKILELGVPNARIARYDAWSLADLFGPGEIAGLHVNHPDPWGKQHQHKHRLLGPHFMGWAATVLPPGAPLRLKTDAVSNVQLMLASMQGLPFELTLRSDDLRQTGTPWAAVPEDDVVTNYQRKTYLKGLPVYGVELRRT